MAKLTLKNVTAALIQERGVILKAAEALGVTRKAVYDFIGKHPELEEVRAEAMDSLLDVAEGHVASQVSAGEMKTIRWFLERQGKNRGYTTRVEQTGADGGPIAVGSVEYEVVDPSPEESSDG